MVSLEIDLVASEEMKLNAVLFYWRLHSHDRGEVRQGHIGIMSEGAQDVKLDDVPSVLAPVVIKEGEARPLGLEEPKPFRG